MSIKLIFILSLYLFYFIITYHTYHNNISNDSAIELIRQLILTFNTNLSFNINDKKKSSL